MMASRLGVALATVIFGSAASVDAQIISIGANPPGNFTYSACATIAKVVNAKAGIEARVQPYGGSSSYVPLLASGELNFATLNAIESTMAITGTGMFEGRKSEGIQAVTVLVPFVSAFFVKKDSGMKTVADLKGKTVPTGYPAQTTLVPLTEALFAIGGFTMADVRSVPEPNNMRGAEDFAAGKLDTFLFAFGAGKVKEVEAQVGTLRALTIIDTPEALAAARKPMAFGYYPYLMQPTPYTTGLTEPGKFLAYDMLFVASAKTPEETVYKLVKTLHDSKDELVAGFAPLRDFQPNSMAKKLDPLEFHSGAVKFYREIGQWPPKG